ncbi:transcriptional regulator, LysR family protein [Salipiger bermudensis HTCC2601]|uniref:Transcriptional regulator, LysR family protein n=1 Tax=Salipiger bermudensis (strain DSM 26914 / JCM 13377 / KCTC 12554 / HTCC2601) TaxID=314265 RepID=Q0FHP7_SALBH|nr:transcriptional regulator, LysR family protein [Salipiger bermudensis HTCC2601]
MEEDVAADIASGKLEAVLEDWTPPFDAVCLFHPSGRQTPPALRALINFLKR